MFTVLNGPSASAADGTWNNDANAVWSGTSNWSGGVIADGAGSIADFSQLNLAAARTITIDGAVASRTVGTLLLGDSTSPFVGYTIASSTNGTLTFNNSGSSAQLVQKVNTGANSISAPVILADNLNISNSSTNTLTLSGSITGAKLITNSGTGSGITVLSGAVSITGVVQDSASSQLTLSGSNAFTSGVTIQSGTLLSSNNNALGSGTLALGATSGSADATLLMGSVTNANTINVRAGSAGTLAIASNSTAAARPTGNILLNNDLTLLVAGGGQSGRSTGAFLATSGTLSGAGGLNLNVSGNLSTSNNSGQPQMDSLSVGGVVSTTGTIRNMGAGSGRAIITGPITNAAALVQDSSTSMLSLSGSNSYSGPTNVNAGVLRIAGGSALSPNSTVTVASGATLQIGSTVGNAGQTVYISGSGSLYTFGAMNSTNTVSYGGSIVLLNDAAISSDLATTTFTLSGGITGTDRNLTVSGIGNTALSGALNTGNGGLTKLGTANLTLSASNSFAGLTTISGGALVLNHAGALGGGGDISFDGGSLRHSSSNTLDLGSRIVNSSSPVAIDTAGVNVTYSGIGASNTAGLSKLGSARLTLAGTNSFSGGISVAAGVLVVSDTSAIPSLGTGQIYIDSGGALNSGGAYANVAAWLAGGDIAPSSSGVIALTGASTEAIDFTGYESLGLGASSNLTYNGTLTPASGGYRLGGGGGTLTLATANALTGTSRLVVSGPVTLTNSNDLSGATTVNGNTLTLVGVAGGLASSAVTLSSGATLAITSATTAGSVTRASGLTLSRSTLTVTGNATANSTDAITGALTVGAGGNSILTITPNSGKNTLLTAGSYAREAGSTLLIRGANLGVNSIASATANNSNISFTSPNLVGGAGSNTTDRGIFVGAIGDTASNGTGLGATGGLLTYDATNGVRLLSAGEYKNSITSGQTQLDNILLSSSAGGTVTTTLNANTTVNSLSLNTNGTGSSVVLGGAGTLTVNSGVIYSKALSSGTHMTIDTTVDLNGREGLFFVSSGNAELRFTGAITNSGGNGVTIYGGSGHKAVFSGATANTYTGTTTVNGGSLTLNKTAGVDAIPGDLLVNSGGAVTYSAANQVADAGSISVNGGTLTMLGETIQNLSASNGGIVNAGTSLVVNGDLTLSESASLRGSVLGSMTVAGVSNFSEGGSLNIKRSQNVNGSYDSVTTLGAVNITNARTDAYIPISIDYGAGVAQSGGSLVLNGDVTFVGNTTNANTALIDAPLGTGRQGIVVLTGSVAGNRTFNIGNGAAAVDFAITAPITDGAAGASGLVKAGAGTMRISGASTYTGATSVTAGKLIASGSLSATTSVSVSNTGSVFELGGANLVNDSATLSLANGQFNANGKSETLGSVTSLSGASTLNLGIAAADTLLQFADSSAAAGAWTGTLTIQNFSSGAVDTRIFFGNSASGLTAGQLSLITFLNPTINGVVQYGSFGADILETGELMVVPEPTSAALLGGMATLLFLQRMRARSGRRMPRL